MTEPRPYITAGYGLFERFLATQRSKKADGLIPSTHRKGRILDIGCGAFPFFLINTGFSEKYGLDKFVDENYAKRLLSQKIALINYDVEMEDRMPFDSEYFDVVVMLAVFEHIQPKLIVKMLREIHRILKPNGMYVMTTPSARAHGLLTFMARLRMVSPVLFNEHKDAYTHTRILSLLQEAHFLKEKLRFGYFEMLMNIWVTATK